MTGTPPTRKTTFKRLVRAFTQDRIVLSGAVVLIALYLMVALSGFLAPYRHDSANRKLAYAPPTPIFVLDQGRPTWPYVVTYTRKFDPETYGFGFYPDYRTRYPLRLFVRGESYRLLGVIPCNVHLFGVDSPARIFLLGTDMNGWDNFSRLLYGGQISLTIGFLALLVSFPLGLLYGGLSGYAGGRLDTLLMRLAEIIMCIPSFYLLVSLTTMFPADWSSTQKFSVVVVILAAIGWAGLARIIRGMVLSLKDLEYVEAARSLGAGGWRIITTHLLPQTATFFIIAATLNVPGYLLAESALSFLGLGIQPPDASWGNMLKEAQDLSNVILRPWLLLGPGLLIFLTILAFNVVGDKIRDVLDPKNHGKLA